MEGFDYQSGSTNSFPSTLPVTSKHAISAEKWSLGLSEITLHPSFGGFFGSIFGKDELINYISFSWDLSPLSSTFYPQLHFLGNNSSFELRPGQTKDFGHYGLNLFPERHVHDTLNVLIFIIKNKKSKENAESVLFKVQKLVNNSPLSQELKELTEENTLDRKDYISFLADNLIGEIEQIIGQLGEKHITTFRLEYPVNERNKFKGRKLHLQNKVRICLNQL